MADPELFVDQPDRLVHRLAALVGHLDVGKSEELQHAIVFAPQGPQFVRGPATLHGRDDLVLVALMLPAMRSVIAFEHVDRSSVFVVVVYLVEHH